MPKKTKSKATPEEQIQALVTELMDGKDITHSAVVSTVGLPIISFLDKNMPEITISAMASSVIAIVSEGHGVPDGKLGEMQTAILSFDNGTILLKKIYGPDYLGILIVYTPLQTMDQLVPILGRIEITAAKLATLMITAKSRTPP